VGRGCFLDHTAVAAIGFFIVAFSTIVFAGHFSAHEVDSKKLVPEKKRNLETMAAVPAMFDVFLNHRGPDVKGSFAAHLHQALQEAGCRPFLDKLDLEKGQPGQKKIYEALRCASVHVAIFSKDYAGSNYCLKELCDMLGSKKLIIPVFYDVSPSVLRCEDPDGPYTKALNIHGRGSASKVKKWKDALHTAAELNGFKLDDYNGDQAELKTAIVSKVRDHLRASQQSPAIMNELIREYLLFNDWGETACVFIPEAGQPEIPFHRAFLAGPFGIQEDALTRQNPLLHALVSKARRVGWDAHNV
jgi:hypothetical protein